MSGIEGFCEEFQRLLPPLWHRTLAQECNRVLLTGAKAEPFVEIAQRYLNHCVQVNDREGIKKAQRLLTLAIEQRSPERVAEIEQALGLAAAPAGPDSSNVTVLH